jgi:hypothetical protein
MEDLRYFLGGAPALNTATNVASRRSTTRRKSSLEAKRDRNVVIGFHLALLAGFAWSGYLVQYLVLWVLPLVTVVQAILRLRAIAEHGATTDFSSPLTAARTNTGPAWLEWLIFPHHVNYHIEHTSTPRCRITTCPPCTARWRRAGCSRAPSCCLSAPPWRRSSPSAPRREGVAARAPGRYSGLTCTSFRGMIATP